MAKEQFERFQSKTVEDFLTNFTSGSTIRGYRCHLKYFFKVIGKDPDNYIVDVRRLENNEQLDAMETYERDIKIYWKWLIEKKLAPKTISNAVDCVRVFLKQYRIRLDDIVWENIRRRGTGNKPITQEAVLTPEILKKILIHGDAKSRGMCLTLASSGMRIGELVQLKREDVDFDSKPTKINVRYLGPNSGVKTKTSRITFISDEATEALKEWWKQRDKSLSLSVQRTNFPNVKKKIEDDRVFPFETTNARNIWNRMLKKAGLDQKDPRTGRFLIHIHSTRKFFRTKFSKHDRDVAELLMGHAGYLSPNYLRFTEDELKEEYLKGMKHLLIFEAPSDETTIIKELREHHQKEITRLNKKISEQDTKISEQDAKLSNVEKNLVKNPAFREELFSMITEVLETASTKKERK